ncbi:hypothetical protein Hanom_Chr03g00188681 [Helianthus anomalus]
MCFGKYPSSNPKNIKPHNTIHSLSRLFVRFPNLYNASIALQLLSHLKTIPLFSSPLLSPTFTVV